MENITNEQYVNLILKYGKKSDDELIKTELKVLCEDALKEFDEKDIFYKNTNVSFDEFLKDYIYSRLASFWKNSSKEFQKNKIREVIEFSKKDLNGLEKIWENTNDEVQKENYQILDEILTYIIERDNFDCFEDSDYLIKIWGNSDKYSQEKCIDKYLEIVKLMKNEELLEDLYCIWFETPEKIQSITFSKFLEMFKDNSNFLERFWTYTKKEVQEKKADEFLKAYKNNMDIKIDEIKKSFYGFEYNDLVNSKMIDDINNFSVMLNKNKFQIPYEYATELIEHQKYKEFFDNTDFRFFRGELSDINEKLSEQSKLEKISFYKFARCLGCFSKEKIKDKNGNDTEIIVGQKASSFLANMIKTPNFRLRKFSRIIF